MFRRVDMTTVRMLVFWRRNSQNWLRNGGVCVWPLRFSNALLVLMLLLLLLPGCVCVRRSPIFPASGRIEAKLCAAHRLCGTLNALRTAVPVSGQSVCLSSVAPAADAASVAFLCAARRCWVLGQCPPRLRLALFRTRVWLRGLAEWMRPRRPVSRCQTMPLRTRTCVEVFGRAAVVRP